MFPKIKILKLKFFLKPLEKIILPEYKGSTFRGAFGIAFKRAVCVFHNLKDCNDCIVKKQCAYLNVFETPLPESIPDDTLDFLKIKKTEHGTHPFIIEPSPEKRQIYNTGDIIIFDMVLFGRAIQYYPYFVHSVSEIGKIGIGKYKGRFQIERIIAFEKQDVILHSKPGDDKENKRKITDLLNKAKDYPSLSVMMKPHNYEIMVDIYNKEKNTLRDFNNNFLINNNFDILDGHLTLEFITPARLKSVGRYLTTISFQNIVINLIRRVYSLLVFHYDFELKEEHKIYAKELINESKTIDTLDSKLTWYNWERFSARQNTRMNLGGLLGEITFSGSLSNFSELIHLGQYLHLGKNTSFGLGEYRIKN